MLLKIIAEYVFVPFQLLICITMSYNEFSGLKVHLIVTTITPVIGEARLAILLRVHVMKDVSQKGVIVLL